MKKFKVLLENKEEMEEKVILEERYFWIEQLRRVNLKIKSWRNIYNKHFNNFNNLSDEEKSKMRKTFDASNWNYWLDKRWEIEDELVDNYKKYQNYHFETHGWCAY